MSRSGPVLLACLLAFPLHGQSPESCATSPATLESVRALDRFVSRHAPHVLSSTVAPAAANDGFVVLTADDVNTPFNRRFDLEGRSLSFTLQSDGTYAVASVPLRFDSDLGTPLAIPPVPHFAPWTLTRFALPFFDRMVTQLYVSRDGAIFTAPPGQHVARRYDALEAAGIDAGVIAPLLYSHAPNGIQATVHVKELDDRAVFTWSGATNIQATLFRSGEIVYSYNSVEQHTDGAIMLSKGSLPRRPLGAQDDPAGDVAAIAALPPNVAPMLDIRSVSVSRLADLDLLEVRITTTQATDWSAIPESSFATFEVSFGGTLLRYMVYGDGFEDAYLPVRSMTFGPTTAARVEGSTLVFRIDQDHLSLDPGTITFTARTRYSTSGASADEVSFPIELRAPAQTFETDFSTSGARVSDMLVEAFTPPGFNPHGAWRQLRARYGFTDAEVDGVAFYQNFATDIAATAYSTVGNSGADGVWMNGYSSSARPKSPALLHMNQLGKTGQSTLLHELGHRWLFWIDFIDENGNRSSALNLLSHPAERVHTAAAFGDGVSPLGGRFWTDNGNGTFTAQGRPRTGFSWIELYLMGLAAPSEMRLFYLDGVPMFAAGTVTATRKDVTAEQVIAAIGPRNPAYPQAQKKFNMLFVLVADATRPVSPEELRTMSEVSRAFPETFRVATGSRGEITLLAPQAAPRRRSVRH